MKEIKIRNKTATYKAIKLTTGKWLDFESGQVKSVDANTRFNHDNFELVEEKPEVEPEAAPAPSVVNDNLCSSINPIIHSPSCYSF